MGDVHWEIMFCSRRFINLRKVKRNALGPAQNTSVVGTQHYKTGVCVCMMRIVLATGLDVDSADKDIYLCQRCFYLRQRNSHR